MLFLLRRCHTGGLSGRLGNLPRALSAGPYQPIGAGSIDVRQVVVGGPPAVAQAVSWRMES
jgi:hypothetical protein